MRFTDCDCGDCPLIVLVATKCDLEEFRVVSRKEAVEWAKECEMPYIETSAKYDKNVNFMIEHGIYLYWMRSLQNNT